MTYRFAIIIVLAALAGGLALDGCTDPLSIETQRRIIPVNIDSILLSEPFLSKETDSVYAVIDGEPISFDSDFLRPTYCNQEVNNAWYVNVQASKFHSKGSGYQVLYLIFDAIRDTGSYPMQGKYHLPKFIDPNAERQLAAAYEPPSDGTPQLFNSHSGNSSDGASNGLIRVVGIDEARGVMVGTFEFTGYDASGQKTIDVQSGIFRLRLFK